MEKFERLNEPTPQRETVDQIILLVIIFVAIILGGAWYYQNYIFKDPSYEKENQIKKLEEEKRQLEEEIKRVLEENSQLKADLQNRAQILRN